jgi:hypothetical protein
MEWWIYVIICIAIVAVIGITYLIVSRFRGIKQRIYQLDKLQKTRQDESAPIRPPIELIPDEFKMIVPANTKLGGKPDVHNLEDIVQSIYDAEEKILQINPDNQFITYSKTYRDKYGFCFNIRDVSKILIDICKEKKITNFHEAMCGRGFIPIMMRYNDPDYTINITASDIYDSSWYTSTDIYNIYNNIKSIIDKPVSMSADIAISEITVPNSIVLLSWVPPRGDSGIRALNAILRNPNIGYLVSIDESGWFADDFGCIGTKEYFDILKTNFKLEQIYERDIIYTLYDTMKLYTPIRT